MQITQITRTIIEADEGKILRRISDGFIAGEKVHLGYNYYEAGVPLAEAKLEVPDDYEEIDAPEDYEAPVIINQSKRLERMTQLLEEEKKEFKNRGLSAADMIKHKQFAPKWGEDEGFREGDAVKKGDKFTYDGKLWAVLQDHTILAHYEPSINTAALYVEVTEDYTEAGEELGTLENPIPYEGNMVLESGKYYSQDGVTYLCNRDSGNAVYHNLSDLVGLYVEVA
ncbi:MAG: hypothetical protein J6B82_08305 [Bacteroidaceae bacterium]|nr:hypothetical protein [Bacteroidaceae bacterium]